MAERPTSRPDSCPTGFPEEMLSGYLDGMLTQSEEQRVRLHLEDCRTCRTTHHDLATLREATMTTEFSVPPDDQWKEAPRGPLSWLFRGAGWLLVAGWFAVAVAFALWQFLTSPGDAFAKALAFAGISGFVLLFLSVLVDRLKTFKTDRYRRVDK